MFEMLVLVVFVNPQANMQRRKLDGFSNVFCWYGKNPAGTDTA